jgi:hypothetical protein
MQTIDMAGAQLTPKGFITIFRTVVKVSPPRFLTLRLHPDRYDDIYLMADVPESIQVGNVLGPMGKQILKINCVKPPLGVSDGITIVKDPKADPTKLVFELYGISEITVQNIGV